MDTIQFEELRKGIETLSAAIAKLKEDNNSDRVSLVAKLKGQVWKMDEVRLTMDVPAGNNPHEWAVQESENLIDKVAKSIQGLASGVNGTNQPPMQYTPTQTPAVINSGVKCPGKIVNNICSVCGTVAKVSKTGNQYLPCWYPKP